MEDQPYFVVCCPCSGAHCNKWYVVSRRALLDFYDSREEAEKAARGRNDIYEANQEEVRKARELLDKANALIRGIYEKN